MNLNIRMDMIKPKALTHLDITKQKFYIDTMEAPKTEIREGKDINRNIGNRY
ncbi:predicted protein [Botrytis cinerea T4]|uniref:Uncharacterized protein n=1 Tax=Botryotinia fuckeliana (strain T4) TaxID=999810 RepID=G2YUK3_BOTF4|nr:predicted protein [Botrytis cinerea T4]